MPGYDHEALSADISARLIDIPLAFAEAGGEAGIDMYDEATSASNQAAYIRGYEDALREPVRGSLYLKHGIPVPRRNEVGT